jgi:Glycosyl hydrolase family 47.
MSIRRNYSSPILTPFRTDSKSTNAIIDKLLYLTPKRNLLYVTDINSGIPSNTFEHLSCFLPGLLALGAQTLKLPPRDKQRHEWAAQGLAYTCWMTYADQATGLGPDEMVMDSWPLHESGRWVHHMDQWEKAGRPGGRPPGLRDVPAESKEHRDYTANKPAYLLRPEVS